MITRKLNNSSALTLLAAGTMAIVLGAVAPASAADVETVVVTGSRIPTSNIDSPSPISIKGAASIEMTSA